MMSALSQLWGPHLPSRAIISQINFNFYANCQLSVIIPSYQTRSGLKPTEIDDHTPHYLTTPLTTSPHGYRCHPAQNHTPIHSDASTANSPVTES